MRTIENIKAELEAIDNEKTDLRREYIEKMRALEDKEETLKTEIRKMQIEC